MNFTDYLAKVRISKAMRLLNETGTSSTEIAFACGFNNVTSFYNTFKRIKGMSPGEYKKNPTQKGSKDKKIKKDEDSNLKEEPK